MKEDKTYAIKESELEGFYNAGYDDAMDNENHRPQHAFETFLKDKQPVDRDRVGDVLEEWFDTPNKADKILYSFKKEIIDQICNLAVPEGEVVAEGKVKIKDKVPCWYVGDSEVLNLIRGVVHKYEGKTIQIIIREVGN